MSTSTTLRLAGLVAAIAVSLSVTSSAFAMPEGFTARQAAATQTVSGPADNPAEVGTPVINSPIARADNPADIGSPTISNSPMVRIDNPGDIGSPVATSPMVRVDNPADVGTPSVGLLPAIQAPAASTSFSWQDATLGALVGLALACLAAFAMGTMRGRRLAIRA